MGHAAAPNAPTTTTAAAAAATAATSNTSNTSNTTNITNITSSTTTTPPLYPEHTKRTCDRAEQPRHLLVAFDGPAGTQRRRAALDCTSVHAHALNPAHVEVGARVEGV